MVDPERELQWEMASGEYGGTEGTDVCIGDDTYNDLNIGPSE